MAAAVMQRQRVGGSAATVLAAYMDCVGGRIGRAGRGRDRAFLVKRGWRPRDEEGRKAAAAVVFRKEWYRKTGKEVMDGCPLLHRLLGFKSRCKGCLKLIIMMLF